MSYLQTGQIYSARMSANQSQSIRSMNNSFSHRRSHSANPKIFPWDEKVTLKKIELDNIEVIHQKYSPLKGFPSQGFNLSINNAPAISGMGSMGGSILQNVRSSKKSAFWQSIDIDRDSSFARRSVRSSRGRTVDNQAIDPIMLTELKHFSEQLPPSCRLEKNRAVPIMAHIRSDLNDLFSTSDKLPSGDRMEIRSIDGLNLLKEDDNTHLEANIGRKISAFRESVNEKTGKRDQKSTASKEFHSLSPIKAVPLRDINVSQDEIGNPEDICLIAEQEVHIYNPRDSWSSHADSHRKTIAQEAQELLQNKKINKEIFAVENENGKKAAELNMKVVESTVREYPTQNHSQREQNDRQSLNS